MKRYLLFMYDEFYPEGGMRDFAGSFDSVEEAKKKWIDKVSLKENDSWKSENRMWNIKNWKESDYYQIYDSVEEKMVETNDIKFDDKA